MRVYTALVLPARAADDLERFLAPIPLPLSGAPKSRTSWHVTFSFHARVDPDALDVFVSALREELSRLPAQQVRLQGSGAFCDIGTNLARYLWMRPTIVGPTDQPFFEASDACSRAAQAAGMTADQYGFSPHLTLAELSSPREAEEWLEATGTYQGPIWDWASLDVIEVRRDEAGQTHHVTLASLPLGAGS